MFAKTMLSTVAAVVVLAAGGSARAVEAHGYIYSEGGQSQNSRLGRPARAVDVAGRTLTCA
jgi:hypothetical protein